MAEYIDKKQALNALETLRGALGDAGTDAAKKLISGLDDPLKEKTEEIDEYWQALSGDLQFAREALILSKLQLDKALAKAHGDLKKQNPDRIRDGSLMTWIELRSGFDPKEG